jgi:16S rRNA (cytidine1402-2'-O)-methyltransferase
VERSTCGTLFIVGTPIGNLGDITLRALETLKSVDLIAAEDTRQTIKLLNHYGIKKPVTSYFEHNKLVKGPVLIQELLEGKNVALVSDAGMPGISDPGAQLIRECIGKEIPLTVIPGPSAVLTGLVASGLDTTGFVFCGFFPREKKEKKRLLDSLGQETRTMVFYESPHRLRDTLLVIQENWGNRQCCVARELTKVFEEYVRGTISHILAGLEDKSLKGEITLIIEGNQEGESKKLSFEEAESCFRELVSKGMSKKEAVKEAARLSGIPKRELYQRVMIEDY